MVDISELGQKSVTLEDAWVTGALAWPIPGCTDGFDAYIGGETPERIEGALPSPIPGPCAAVGGKILLPDSEVPGV